MGGSSTATVEPHAAVVEGKPSCLRRFISSLMLTNEFKVPFISLAHSPNN